MCIVIQISSKPFITQREVGDIDLSFVHTCVYILPSLNIYVFFNCPLSDILVQNPFINQYPMFLFLWNCTAITFI